MNLIDIFESKPFQDVGTFNSVFKITPILGFDVDLEVVIGLMTPTGRKLTVGGKEIILDLAVSKKDMQKVGVKKAVKSRFKQPVKSTVLSSLYKELSPSEFMLYCAIRELGTVFGVSHLSRNVNLSTKTCTKVLKELQNKKLVNVTGDYCGISKIVLTQEIK